MSSSRKEYSPSSSLYDPSAIQTARSVSSFLQDFSSLAGRILPSGSSSHFFFFRFPLHFLPDEHIYIIGHNRV